MREVRTPRLKDELMADLKEARILIADVKNALKGNVRYDTLDQNRGSGEDHGRGSRDQFCKRRTRVMREVRTPRLKDKLMADLKEARILIADVKNALKGNVRYDTLDKLLQAENLLTYCESRLRDAREKENK